jgi:hypothetical protein
MQQVSMKSILCGTKGGQRQQTQSAARRSSGPTHSKTVWQHRETGHDAARTYAITDRRMARQRSRNAAWQGSRAPVFVVERITTGALVWNTARHCATNRVANHATLFHTNRH